MIKWLFERFRRDRGRHLATVRIDFSPQDQVTPSILWYQSQDKDPVPLVVHLYARFLYELAELNKVQVARELMAFLDQVYQRVLACEGPPRRPRLNLGQLRLTQEPTGAAVRTYRAEFYRSHDGQYRLEFQGSLGKESFYLPGAFLALLQSCLDQMDDVPLRRLSLALSRLHTYYRFRRDFWDGGALAAGPTFALGTEEIRSEEAMNSE
jgi:hypothetical protein